MAGANNSNAVPQNITPQGALALLKEGNDRFVKNVRLNRDLLEQVGQTAKGQHPFAAILSCMDSRTSAEITFDQGIGHVFSIRIAGNVVSEDILGSLEYATKAVGTPLIVVLGHTGCGAIKGACDDVQMGNLTGLLAKIRPAIDQETTEQNDRSSQNTTFVNKVTHLNTRHSVQQILDQSDIIRDLVAAGKAGIVSATYDVATGAVTFDEQLIVGAESLQQQATA